LVSAPTVIASGLTGLDDAETKIADAATSSLMLRAAMEEDGLALYSGETRLGGVQDCMDRFYGKTLLLIELDDADAADALAAHIEENELEDLQVASTDGALLREFRAKAPATRASLMLDTETLTRAQAAEAVGAANMAKAKNIIIRQSAANKEAVEQMQRLLMSVWVLSDDTTTGLFRAVQSGANGVITAEPERLASLAELFTGRTLTRRSFIIGHRGTPGSAPENTMAGYKMAYEKYGAQMIENDVYLTKDKEVIVLHDDTFARTTDILTNAKLPDSVFTNGVTRQNCRPRDLTLEQVRMLDAGSYYGEAFAGEPVPTLCEMLEYIKGKDLVLFLELKDASEGIEKACTDMIKEFDMQDQVCCITFNAKSVPITLDEMPTMSIGYLSGVGSVNTANPMVTVRKALNQVLPMNSTFNPSYGAIHNETFVQQMQGRGMTLWPWTYNSQSAYQWAIDHGINGLTTNYADWSMDAVFGIEAEQDAYSLAEGETLSLKATGKTNTQNVVQYDAPEIVVLEGGENIQVSGNAVTGVKMGTAVVSLRAKSQMGAT
ncbi:glycerophosphodiester phosphodiesterase family protein, partial [Blautia wexlerae]|nr:glycerophosphodiester phosphodiesterase family protein [Blautia wexlerae]